MFNIEETDKMALKNPDLHTEDLFDGIKKGDYPS